MDFNTVSVVLEKTAYSFDKPYSYKVPQALSSKCRVGCRVIVPFGRSNTERQGLILECSESENADGLKEILRIADEEPILSDEMVKLCIWLHEKLFCTYFDAVSAVLPAGVSLKITTRFCVADNTEGKILPSGKEKDVYEYLRAVGGFVPLEKVLRECDLKTTSVLNSLVKNGFVLRDADAARRMNDATLKSVRCLVNADDIGNFSLTEKQREVAREICSVGKVSVKELQYFTGVSVSVIDALVKKGIAEYYEQEIYRKPKYRINTSDKKEIVLNDEQQAAYNTFKGMLNTGGDALLYGVTGSGKTQVFLKAADAALEKGKDVIIMVPEISLTPQALALFGRRYGDNIAVFHSAMSLGERMDEWKRIKQGKAHIAIGTRSAVFAPTDNLGLIIMDEEQEHTYKSEQSPRYHARDIAHFRAAYHKALFVMASATPCIETYTKALSGKYKLCRLNKRYGNADLPSATVVDMRAETAGGNAGNISGVLYDEIESALENGKQAIVLLNRRGHDTYVSCPSCSAVITCPKCSISLTYHSANKSLMCHYCGFSRPVPQKCDVCGNTHLKFSGAGTQKLEEELKILFPCARILRLDADTTMAKDSYYNFLNDFSSLKYDIMIGTQMVAKGLDFPNVTVVGVVGADKALNSEDYKSSERTFSLLTQVVGRAGRGDESGRAVIQTNDPDNSIITLAQKQDYDAFYNEEMMLRKAFVYPPYCDIAAILVQSFSADVALGTAKKILNGVKDAVQGNYKDVSVIVLGPTVARVPKVNNRYRFRLLIKCKNNRRLRQMLREAVDFKYEKDTSVIIDMNPETIF